MPTFPPRVPRLALGLVLVLAGCGSTSSGHSEVASAWSMTHPSIVPNTKAHGPDSLYVPDPLTVRVGQTITWTNKDTDPHDVTALDGSFDSGPLAMGASFRWTPTRPGTYPYFCTVHPEMHGTIIVQR